MTFKFMARKVLAVGIIASVTAPALGREATVTARPSIQRKDGMRLSFSSLQIFSGIHELSLSQPVTDRLSVGLTYGFGEAMSTWLHESYEGPKTSAWEAGLRSDYFLTSRTRRWAFGAAVGVKYSQYDIRLKEPRPFYEGDRGSAAGVGSWIIADARTYVQWRPGRHIHVNAGVKGRAPLWENYGYGGPERDEIGKTQTSVLPMIEAGWVF